MWKKVYDELDPPRGLGKTKPISAHQAGARDLESATVRRPQSRGVTGTIGLQARVVAGNVVQF